MSGEVLGWLVAIAQNLVASFLAVVLGIAFAYLVQRRWDKRQYGGWRVVITKEGRPKVDREISVDKAKEILHEPSDLAVFLKGVASPYEWINCDILQEGVDVGLFVRADQQRRLLIDLDRNPKRPAVSNAQILRAVEQLAQGQGIVLHVDAPSATASEREGGVTSA